MSDIGIREMTARVCGSTLVCRTGILLLPKPYLGREESLAVKLGLEPIDYPAWLQTQMYSGARFLRLTQEKLLQDIDIICSARYRFNCVLLFNFDLAVAYLEYLERPYLWEFLRDRFKKRPNGLIVTMPEQAQKLLPIETEQEIWSRGKRLTRLPNEGM